MNGFNQQPTPSVVYVMTLINGICELNPIQHSNEQNDGGVEVDCDDVVDRIARGIDER